MKIDVYNKLPFDLKEKIDILISNKIKNYYRYTLIYDIYYYFSKNIKTKKIVQTSVTMKEKYISVKALQHSLFNSY